MSVMGNNVLVNVNSVSLIGDNVKKEPFLGRAPEKHFVREGEAWDILEV